MEDDALLEWVAEFYFNQGMSMGELIPALKKKGFKNSGRQNDLLIRKAGQWLIDRNKHLSDMDQSLFIPELSKSLADEYKLIRAIVVPSPPIKTEKGYIGLLRKWGRVAADYFDRLASTVEYEEQHLHVAISGGEANLEMAMQLPDRPRPNVTYYAAALVGRGGMKRYQSTHIGPEANATIAWSRSGRLAGHLVYGTAPPPVGAYEEKLTKKQRHEEAQRKILLATADFERLQADFFQPEMEQINIAVVGLGLVNPRFPFFNKGRAIGERTDVPAEHKAQFARLTMTGLLQPHGISPELLQEEGAVGELSYNLFDRDGNGNNEWRFYVTPGDGVEFYRNLVNDGKTVIAIAGTQKEEVIGIALATQLISVLITDEVTANWLLENRERFQVRANVSGNPLK